MQQQWEGGSAVVKAETIQILGTGVLLLSVAFSKSLKVGFA